MDRRAEGTLAIWHDLPADPADMLAWYNREHHRERIDSPGFLAVRRYQRLDGPPSIFNRYQTTTPAVLSAAPYLALLNAPTPWSLENQRRVTNMCRIVCRTARRTGRAEGGFVATLRFPFPDVEPVLPWARVKTAVEADPRLLAAEFLVADEQSSSLPSREKELRGTPDQTVAAALLLHASDPAALDDLPGALGGLPEGAILGRYGLAFALTNEV